MKAAASSATAITGVPIKRNFYRTEARSAGTPITSVDIAQWEASKDPDIYATSGGTMTVTDAAAQLEVGINTFRPAIPMIVPQVWGRAARTYDAQATSLTVSNQGGGFCDDAYAGIPFCVAGSFLPGTGTVTFTGNAVTVIDGGTFNNIVLNGTGIGDLPRVVSRSRRDHILHDILHLCRPNWLRPVLVVW